MGDVILSVEQIAREGWGLGVAVARPSPSPGRKKSVLTSRLSQLYGVMAPIAITVAEKTMLRHAFAGTLNPGACDGDLAGLCYRRSR